MPWKLSWHCRGSLGGLLLLRALPARSAGSSQPGTEGLISLCNVCSQSQDFNYVFPLLAGSQQSHVCSALLCAMLSHACEKVGLLHSGEVGTEAAHPRVCSWSPCFSCLPGHWSLTPGWEFACGPYAPERGDVRSPLPLGPQLPLGASPVLGCSSSVAVCSPQGSGCSPGRIPTHSSARGPANTPSPSFSRGCPPPGLLLLPGMAKPWLLGRGAAGAAPPPGFTGL